MYHIGLDTSSDGKRKFGSAVAIICEEVRLTVCSHQHGVPRVSAAALDKSEATKEKERKHIEQYRALEKEVGEKVCLLLSITSDIHDLQASSHNNACSLTLTYAR